MTTKQRKANYSEYLFKAAWDSTAVWIKVPGKNLEDAWKRAYSMIKRTEGGDCCEKITFYRKLR